MNSLPPDRKNWISELAGQSWNLEMLISGAAIFSTSFLPELINSWVDAYYDNYQTSYSTLNVVIPTLAYGFAKTIAYLLITTFILHFILRAFWVGMVGLRAVYPDGIIYDKLPMVNDSLREHYKRQFGDVDDFIVRLDRLCSQIFSIAFVLVLFGTTMSMLYLIGFVFFVFLKNLFPFFILKWGQLIGNILTALVFAFGVLVIVLGQKSIREHPRFGKYYHYVARSASWLYFGTYKPINYILLVFASHLSYKRYMTNALLAMLAFFAISVIIFTKKVFELNGKPWLETRQYYSSGAAMYQIRSHHYDNLRHDDEAIEDATIQADVVREPFLKVFIKYTKLIDADLAIICRVATPADSLSRREKMQRLDKARLGCLQQYFQLFLNDSLYHQTEFLYELHGAKKTEGISAYLPTQRLKVGRNILSVKSIDTDSLPKKVVVAYATIPFWYSPEN